VPEQYRRGYVKHAEELVAAVRPSRLSELSREGIEAYLRRLAAWQLRQKVDALRLLLVELADNGAAREIDWNFWAEAGAATLPDTHPILARALTPEQSVRYGVRGSRTLSADAEVSLVKLVRTIRTLQYSIRTEEAYRDWVSRFLSVTGKAPDT
jgi:hypothetical protein